MCRYSSQRCNERASAKHGFSQGYAERKGDDCMLTLTTALLVTASSVQAVGMPQATPLPPATALQTAREGGSVAAPMAEPQSPVPQSPVLLTPSLAPVPAPAVADPATAVAIQAPVNPAAAPSPASAPAPAPVPAPAPAGPQHDIVVVGRKPLAGDPLRSVNATAFDATNKVDAAVVGPVARAYKRKVPSPIRSGIHNFLYNLREPIVFVNYLLQFKPGKAAETAGRFAINTTAGLAGVLDVAKRKPFRLPRRSNGFANTLGYHGVKNGPFLFLPLVGPTTVRDLFGGAIDRLLLPVAVGSPFTDPSYTVPAGVLGALDHRAEFDETLKDLHEGAADPYASSREFYLRRRQAEIDRLHGRAYDPILGPGGTSAPPPRAAMPIIEQKQPAPATIAAPSPVQP